MEVYLTRNEQRSGPHTEGDVRAMVDANEIERTCLAWREGMTDWRPLEEVVALSARPPRPQLPSGLPPVPVHHPTGFDWKAKVEHLNQRVEHFDATKLDSAGKRHLDKVLPILGGIIILLINLKCHH